MNEYDPSAQDQKPNGTSHETFADKEAVNTFTVATEELLSHFADKAIKEPDTESRIVYAEEMTESGDFVRRLDSGPAQGTRMVVEARTTAENPANVQYKTEDRYYPGANYYTWNSDGTAVEYVTQGYAQKTDPVELDKTETAQQVVKKMSLDAPFWQEETAQPTTKDRKRGRGFLGALGFRKRKE